MELLDRVREMEKVGWEVVREEASEVSMISADLTYPVYCSVYAVTNERRYVDYRTDVWYRFYVDAILSPSKAADVLGKIIACLN